MRVYEFAKSMGVPNKKIIEVLTQEGHEVASHMSALSEKELDFLRGYFKKQRTQKPSAPPTHKTVKINKVSQPKPISAPVPEPIKEKKPFVIEPMMLSDAAERLDKPASEVILTLLRQGIVCAKNQVLSKETLSLLARHYDIQVERPAQKIEKEETAAIKSIAGTEERPPVVVVVGHVDHGKTTLLDFIRKTRVAAREKGGITQHLGAYEVKTPHGGIIFLDTPGHAAFTKMRARGVKVADIAILVVAADDGVMPQTVEAIKHIKSLNVPVIVAINKVDKVGPEYIDKVKTGLAQYDLLPEDWGGQIVCVPVSALQGKGVTELLEIIALQAQIMDLKADLNRPAMGFVLEAKLEKGRGPVATVICHHGKLHIGDYFSTGSTTGKVSSLVDSYGNRVQSVGPSTPVQVAGFSELPDAGDFFEVISKEKQQVLKNSHDPRRAVSLKPITSENTLNIILKVDTHSTKEALLGSVEKIAANFEKKLHIVHAALGDITESDVMLAVNTGSRLYGLHIKTEPNALGLAQRNMIDIKIYDIIYKLLDDLVIFGQEHKEVKVVTKKTGEAVVLKVFDIKDLGVIAGCLVKEGIFSRKGHVVVWRGKAKIGEGPIKSLQRERRTVKEVHAGFECGFIIEGFNDFQVDDRVECYLDVAENQ